MPSSDATLTPEMPEMPADLPGSNMTGSTVDLATDEPRSTLDRVLSWVPRVLSSKPHVIVLIGLGVYLNRSAARARSSSRFQVSCPGDEPGRGQ